MSLTTTMGVKLGPILLGTLVKHYLERHNVTRDSKARNELLFDEAFIVLKSFMEESTKHTVEELQQFSNTRIPSPPWVHNVRVLIPLSCCDEAAPLLLQALGGPEAVGGSKWWQVRGVRGVDAQWVAVKRDWREAERRRKQRQDEPGVRRQGTVNEHSNRHSTVDSTGKRDHTYPTRHNTVNEHTTTRHEDGSNLRRSKTGTTHSRPVSTYGIAGERGASKRPTTSGGVGTSQPMTDPSNGVHPNSNDTRASVNKNTPLAPETHRSPPKTGEPEPMNSTEEAGVGEEEGEAHYEPEMDDMKCMLYIHGGGYYFGSVDQQRYCVQRYARKMGGRVLAVNYRLAPQYPFPCALHDCLAAYLYLIQPPPGAKHLPVPPSMVIIAGDSAGGGMTLALLQIIRDVGLPAPAGGVLISPWCDLTHSFPSVLTNTKTDIIPPYGLSLHKPSTLWPPPSDDLTAEIHGKMKARVREVVRLGKNKLGLGPSGASALDLSTLNEGLAIGTKPEQTSRPKPRSKSMGAESRSWWRRNVSNSDMPAESEKTTARGNTYIPPPPGASLGPTLETIISSEPQRADSLGLKLIPTINIQEAKPESIPLPPSRTASPEPIGADHVKHAQPVSWSAATAPWIQPVQMSSEDGNLPTLNQPRVHSGTFSRKPPKHQTTVDPAKSEISVEIDGQMRAVRSQIQLYAQNHQLTHPLVSPALGYLGGLPPLFVLASDKEVLRDEIIYVAHKAAHPDRYPVKPEAKERLNSLKDIEQKGYPPTKVHLQVYDETCHVLPLFSFTTPAKYCYRAIALFCKHTTNRNTPSSPPTPVVPDAAVARSPELETTLFGLEIPSAFSTGTPTTPGTPPTSASTPTRRPSLTSPRSLTFSPSLLRRRTSRRAGAEPLSPKAGPGSPVTPGREQSDDIAGPRFNLEKNEPPSGPGTAGDPSVYNLQFLGKPSFDSPFTDNMIRERVSTSGVLRPLEPESELPGCTMDLSNIGVINAAAVKRYLEGQALWDDKFASTIKGIAKARAKNLELARKEGRKSMGALHGALANGGIVTGSNGKNEEESGSASSSMTFLGSSTWNMSWALDGEHPPPSSIVSRRDTAEARRLAVCADRDLGDEHKMSGNNLWSVVVNFLTQTPDRNAKSDDPLVANSSDSSNPGSNLNVNVQPPTPSSPVLPTNAPSLPRKRSSTFLRKFIGRESSTESPKSTPRSTIRRPLSLFIDSSRNSGLPVVDKP